MAKPTQATRVVPMIRGGFQRALLQLAEEGRPISDIIHDELLENPMRALDTLAKFCPKELMLQGDPENPLQAGGEFSVNITYKQPSSK